MKDKIIWTIVAFLAGCTLMYVNGPDNFVEYPHVIVSKRDIIQREVDTIQTFVERLVYVFPNPIQIAVAPGGAQEQVQSFCKPLTIVQTDTVGQTVDPELLLRSVDIDRRWAWRRDHLFLTGVRNNGDLVGMDWRVRGDVEIRAAGNGVNVQYPRTSLLYDIWEGGSQVYTAFEIVKSLIQSIR